MRYLSLISILFFWSQIVFAQFSESKIKLPNELNEISGIAVINDSVIAAINDSGNEPKVFFLDLKGRIIHSSLIAGATNVDWEDLIIENLTMYIGDFGNNNSERRDLCIYKVDISKGWKKDTLKSEKIEFYYSEQNHFPPTERGELKFDCEAFYFSNGLLHLVSKGVEKPWIGRSRIYPVPCVKGRYSVVSNNAVFINSKDWMGGAVTSCCVRDSNLTFLTYRKIVIFDTLNLLSQKSIYNFKNLKQREGICVFDKENYLIVSERNWLLGGPYLYTVKKK